MSFPALQLTDAGRALIINALNGGSIEFTKIKAGNGAAPASIDSLTDLVSAVKTLNIGDITEGEGCVSLTVVLDNENLESGYWWRELGVYAQDEDENEVLYAYANAGEYAEYIPAYSNTSYLRTTINVTVIVGDAEKVSAIISEYIGYVTTETFMGHVNNTSNPHSVTKSQVGLGNVPNVSTNDQTPTFTASSGIATIISGEKMSVIMGKIKSAISWIVSHISARNPHGITTSMIGAASASHQHSASDISGGTLPVNRGGTGATTKAKALQNLVDNNDIVLQTNKSICGVDSDDNKQILIQMNSSNLQVGNGTLDKPLIIRNGSGYIQLTTHNNGSANITRMFNTGEVVSAQGSDMGASSLRWGTVYCTGLSNSSDLKYKENIAPISKAKEIVMGLTPISYNKTGKDKYEMGFGAQDVFDLFQRLGVSKAAVYDAGLCPDDPDAIGTSALSDDDIKAHDDADLRWGLDYSQLIAPLVSVIQEQERRISALENREVQ